MLELNKEGLLMLPGEKHLKIKVLEVVPDIGGQNESAYVQCLEPKSQHMGRNEGKFWIPAQYIRQGNN